MQVISAEIFNQQITPGNSQIYKIYRDRLLIQGPVFSLDQKKLALQYCQAYQKKNPNSLCLLVQEQYYFQSWKEDSLIQDNTSLNWMFFRENTYATAPSDSISFAEPNKPQNINTEILLEFINLCQKLLSQAIGPIGIVICQRIASQNSHLSCQEFIEILSQKIPDSQQSLKVKESLLQFIEDNIGLNILLKDMSEQLYSRRVEIDIITTLDLEKIVTKMRDPGGIVLKNRRYNFKIYSNCFMGSELVDWMTKNLNLSTKQAIKLGQRLIDEKFIYHVMNQINFENKYLLYRFYENEIRESE